MSDLTREQVEEHASGRKWYPNADLIRALATQLLATMRENEALVAFVVEAAYGCDCIACGVADCGSPECIAAIVADYERRQG
jgi:hypothetical protein